jgi:hypothetical protein
VREKASVPPRVEGEFRGGTWQSAGGSVQDLVSPQLCRAFHLTGRNRRAVQGRRGLAY